MSWNIFITLLDCTVHTARNCIRYDTTYMCVYMLAASFMVYIFLQFQGATSHIQGPTILFSWQGVQSHNVTYICIYLPVGTVGIIILFRSSLLKFLKSFYSYTKISTKKTLFISRYVYKPVNKDDEKSERKNGKYIYCKYNWDINNIYMAKAKSC